MIISKVHAVAVDRGYRQADLAKAAGIRLPTLSDMYTGKIKRIQTEYIDGLCRVLHCQPGDLFEYVPDNQ